jgi:Protein of unknown function (DUF3224)
MTIAHATFDVQMAPADSGLDDVSRFDLTKQWQGDLSGTSNGIMLSSGDPESGAAGYVAIEVFVGVLHGRRGTFALQQLGTMDGEHRSLTYQVVPGSGTGDMLGLTGTVTLTVDDVHQVELDYESPTS